MKQREFVGWDGHLRAGNTIYPTLCNASAHGAMLNEMVRAGRLGTKTKQGFWKYTDHQIVQEKAEYERKLLAALALLQPEFGNPSATDTALLKTGN
jgi:3-hydroxyacyl-CoA dehydrogenase